MSEGAEKERLEELIEGEIDRQNLEELLKQAHASFKMVDYTDRRIRELKEQMQGASESQKRDLAQRLGILLFATGRYREAIAELEPVKVRKEAAHFLGRSYLELNEMEMAVSNLEKGRLGDEDFDTDMLIAEAHCRRRDPSGAEKLCKKYLDSHADRPDLLCMQGRIAETKGEYSQAVESFQKALEKDPEHRESLFRLAYNYDLNGEDERAMELYERCAGIQPTCIGALINLGVLYEDHGEYQKAIQCYRRVLAIEPAHERVQLFLRDAESSLAMEGQQRKTRALSDRSDVLEMPIDNFELSARSRKCLGNLGVKTLGDLTRISEETLVNSKNFGETSLQEIRELMARNDLAIGQALQGPPSSGLESPADLAVSEADMAERLNTPVESLNLSTRSRNCMEKLQVRTLAELIQYPEQELLQNPNFGRKSISEIKAKLSVFGLKLKGE